MIKLIQWLRSLEQLASELYADGAARFEDQPEVSAFLRRLAEDEAWHYHVMGSELEFLHLNREELPTPVKLTDELRQRVEGPLRRAKQELADGTLTSRGMMELIARTEWSEWNKFFLYAVDVLASQSRLFQFAAAAIQAHQKRIEQFINGLPDDVKPQTNVSMLPPVWRTKILILEDDEALRGLLASLLSDRGACDAVANGADGLDKLRSQYYDVVVSDIDMPVMDGMAFFQHGQELDPSLTNRCLFVSGAVTKEAEQFLQKYQLPYLCKPFAVDEVLEAVDRILADGAERMP